MIRRGSKNRSFTTRHRHMRAERLERRHLMAAYISELMVDPLFGNEDTDQYIELRGEPNAVLPQGTYFAIVSDLDDIRTGPGQLHGLFDLSGLQFGSNGFMVLQEMNSRFSVRQELLDSALKPQVYVSTETGFGNIAGDIYSDIHPISERIDFILGSNTYFLLQSDEKPQLGQDIDTNNDGLIDKDGMAGSWEILDSISLHHGVFTGPVAYGQVVFVEDNKSPSSHVVKAAEGVDVVHLEGSGYAARVGDSSGHTAKDWVSGTVTRQSAANTFPYRFEDGIFGVPEKPVFMGRNIDHLGESNFVSGIHGAITQRVFDADGKETIEPVEGVKFLVDSNGNGKRDSIDYVIDPGVYPVRTELTNIYPGVTLTVDGGTFGPTGFLVQPANHYSYLYNTENVFSSGGIDWFDTDGKLRADFYRPVQAVSVTFIGTFGRPTYGRLDAFNSKGELLGTARTKALGEEAREKIRVFNVNSDIAYVMAYSDENYLNSSPFGAIDSLTFTLPEAILTTDENGKISATGFMPDDYNIVPIASPDVLFATPLSSIPFKVTGNENITISQLIAVNNNPRIAAAEFTLAEDAAVGTEVGSVSATDDDTNQTISFSLEDAQLSPLEMDAVTGALTVRDSTLLDFETLALMPITVIATDSVGGTTSREIFLKLTDVNEAPVVEKADFDVSEEATQGAAIGRVFAFDPEAPTDDPHFEIVGGTGADDFEIDPSTGVITVKAVGGIDFESSHSVTIEVAVSDHSTPPMTSRTTLTVSLVDANDPPKISTETLSAVESLKVGQSLGFIEATDQDTTQKFQFRIVEGGSNTFRIDDESGELFLTAPLDFETKAVYELKIQVVDNGAPPRATTKTVKVQVGDADEPASLKVSEFNVAENSATETAIGTLEVIDPEKATGFTFASMDDSNPGLLFGGLVKLNQATGKLTVAPGAELDTESAAELSDRLFIYHGTDIAGEVTVKLNVTDINEAPTVTNSSVEFPKNFPAARGFVAITAEDPEQDDLSFEITGSAAEKFYVVSSNQLAVKAGVTLDFDATPEFKVAVKVTDSEGNSSTKEITVTQGDLPRVGTVIPDLKIPVGTPYLFQLPFRFRNPNVRSITMIGSGPDGELPKGLRFDPTTGRIVGTAVPSAASTTQVKVQITEPDGDEEFTKEEEFELTIERSEKPLLNPTNQYDVDANGRVNPLDALRIINFIAKNGNGGDAVALADVAEGFFDCSGNNIITAQDALLIINQLRRTTTSSPSDSTASSGATTGATPAIAAAGESTRLAAPESKSQLVDQAMLELSQGSLF